MTALLRIGHRRRVVFPVGRSITCDERLRPYRQLAIRVLARAVLDVTDPAGSTNDRESARAFLSGSAMLEHWCHVAAVDPHSFGASLERLTQSVTTPKRLRPSTPYGESGNP